MELPAIARSLRPLGSLSASLTRPRRPPQRLWRLAEAADEGTAHPFGIAKAGGLRYPFDRFVGGLDALPRYLNPQPFDRLRRRGAGLGDEGAGEMPRAHPGTLGQVLDRQGRIEM